MYGQHGETDVPDRSPSMIPVEALRECPALEVWISVWVKVLCSMYSGCNGELQLVRCNDGCWLAGVDQVPYRRMRDGLFHHREKRMDRPIECLVTSKEVAACNRRSIVVVNGRGKGYASEDEEVVTMAIRSTAVHRVF